MEKVAYYKSEGLSVIPSEHWEFQHHNDRESAGEALLWRKDTPDPRV